MITKSVTAMLELKIQLPNKPIYLSQNLPVKVSLFNKGHAPVVINSRLAVGYENSLSRELYADLKNLDTGQPAIYPATDINRDFPVVSDYKPLLPGDSISVTFNLFEYYPIKKSGSYEIILHYQADEKLAKIPEGTWRGILSSEPKSLEILREEPPGKIN